MLKFECYDAESDEASTYERGSYEGGTYAAGRSALISVAGAVDRDRDHDGERVGSRDRDRERDRASPRVDADAEVDAELDSAAAALRSWVVGWTHRFDPLAARRVAEPNPAGVRRLVEAVIDVLLERRPAEQVKRLVSREVFALLTAVTQRRTAARFAARSMVRSIQLHTPGPDAVESTVLVQDGPRVRAVALRFERITAQGLESAPGSDRMNGGIGGGVSSGVSGGTSGNNAQGRLEWRCTALQFA